MGKKPNFLFLFSDQHRGDWMPCDVRNGPFLRLPSLCSLMENGTTFTSAVTPAPLCAPARACLASGRRYRHCRVYTNGENYDACLPSFYAALRSAGYFVGGAGKFDLNKAELDWGTGFMKFCIAWGLVRHGTMRERLIRCWQQMPEQILRGVPSVTPNKKTYRSFV